jgi:hypothetical protein
MMHGIRRFVVIGAGLALTIGMAVAGAGTASAYGQANWQAAFSGNFNHTPNGSGGFWGWCAFSGGVSSGDEADCSLSQYFSTSGSGASGGNLIAERISGTAWDVEPSFSPPPPPFPQNDFFITAGSVTLTGPTIGSVIRSGAPAPPGCSATGSTATCTIAALEALGFYVPDTGIPAAAGHFSLAQVYKMFGIPIPAGTHVDFQVTQIH